MKNLSKAQELNLELIKLATFNEFDGELVVKDLLANDTLWEGVVMDGDPSGRRPNLIKLRDVDLSWNVSTLYLTASVGKEVELEILVKSWGADEIDWIAEEEAGSALGSWPAPNKLLRVWWD